MSNHGVVRYLFSVLLVTFALAGCGGDVDPATTPAGRAQVQYLEGLYRGDFAGAYNTLHPAYKKIVSQSQFTDCAASTIPVGELDSIEVLDVFDDPIQIPDAGEQDAKAVRVRITSDSGTSITFVNHEAEVADRWNWVLSDSAVTAYQAGRCPGAA
jgi:hypothetical protein